MRQSRSLAIAIVLLALAGSAAAQVTSSTGAINGTVLDSSKSVLPGATVTVQSPQMMGSRETTTDGDGRFQIGGLPPGEYTATFTLTGFSTLVRSDIKVSSGFTATVSAELPVSTLQETITVSGASPVIDTQSTAISNTFDVETMKNLPTSRDFPSLMAETPGVAMTRIDVGGSSAMSETGWRVYGMSGGGNQYTVEGIQVDANYYNDFGSFQEVGIQTAAHTAEMATPGVMSTMVAKSGGNSYHGDFYGDYYSLGWSTRNIDDRQIALGVTGGANLDVRDTNRTELYKDINGNLGGYVMKDKLWWFGSLRYNESLVSFPVFPVHAQLTRVTSRSAKGTYNLNNNNKIIGYYNYNMKYQPERFVVKTQIHPTSDETWDEDFPVGNWKAEYTSVLTQSMFMEVRVGNFNYDFYNFDRAPDRVLYIDTATATRTGGTGANLRTLRTPQFNGALNYFKGGWLGASHNFKLGWMIQNYTQDYSEYGRVHRSGTPVQPDFQHTLVNGVPSLVTFNETPGFANQYQLNYGAYIQDAWQLNNRVSLNLGIRFDRYRGGYPDQFHQSDRYDPATRTFIQTNESYPADSSRYSFNEIGPRVGVIWDVMGNSRTILKANYGSYPWRPSPRSGVPGLNPNAEKWSRTYRWTDLNGDRLWQPGEEGALTNQAGGISTTFIDPNWELDVTRDLAFWAEREVIPNLGMRAGVIWRGSTNPQITYDTRRTLDSYNVPRSIADPGPDGRAGTADDGGSITVYDLDPAVRAATASTASVTTNHPLGKGDSHLTYEVSAVKRMADRWSMHASFTHTASKTLPSGATNPNALISTESDQRNHFSAWQGKLAGSLMLPGDFKLSPVVRHQSGDAFGRIITVVMNYGNQQIQVEPESTNRVSNVTLLDLRMEKGFRARGMRFSGFFDVFNITNNNADQDINQLSGSTYLRPLNIVPPRVARVGAKFEF